MALNDVVVSREGLSRIVRLKVYVDNQYIDSFPGDGVIVSTINYIIPSHMPARKAN
jgi:NAD+ kinase